MAKKKFQMSFDSEIINDFSLQRIRHLKRYNEKQLKRSNLGNGPVCTHCQ